jgi:hypothetical protein
MDWKDRSILFYNEGAVTSMYGVLLLTLFAQTPSPKPVDLQQELLDRLRKVEARLDQLTKQNESPSQENQKPADPPKTAAAKPPAEQLSDLHSVLIRRTDGRTIQCNARKVLQGHPTRIGKWVVYQEIRSDPWGFLNWLNNVRIRAGLALVRYDANLSAWAALNNPPQLAAGASGHHVNPNAWQVAFFGPTNAVDAGNGFLASPGHASVLLDPAITTVGIAASADSRGWAWTVNALR